MKSMRRIAGRKFLTRREVLLLTVSLAIGSVCGVLSMRRIESLHNVMAATATPPLVLKLHRFKLKPDQLDEFDRWIAFEHAHHAETVATLEREHMFVESIFRDRQHDPETIYWLEVRDAAGASVSTSPLAIDKVYDEFMHRTLVPGSNTTLQPEYTLIPDFLLASIRAHQAAK